MAVSKTCTVDGVSIIYSADTVDELVALIKAIEPDFNDGWIEWNGGEMPVPGDTLVQTVERCETKENFMSGSFFAGDFDWSHRDADYDILYYRIVSEK